MTFRITVPLRLKFVVNILSEIILSAIIFSPAGNKISTYALLYI